MPCSHPLQARFCESVSVDGVLGRRAYFLEKDSVDFHCDRVLPEDVIGLPCGRCMPCRLERSRQVALRCVHEAKMCKDNCFVTLTFSPQFLEEMCPLTLGGYSLVRKHTQDFMKRLRKKFEPRIIRVFGCGEYGDSNGRPHYHFCLFNCSFPDRVFWKVVNGFRYYNSACLTDLWSYGHSVIGDFSFETAAYVARYVTKKVTGEKAESHYLGRLPEFSIYSNRPGLGKPWFDKYGKSDVMPTDSCVSRGVVCKVPRYYDKLRERDDPDAFFKARALRVEKAKLKSDDNTYNRLLTKEKCMNARIRLLVRKLDKEI